MKTKKPHVRIQRLEISDDLERKPLPHYRITLYNPNLPQWMRHKVLARIYNAQEAFDVGAAFARAYKTNYAAGLAHEER